MKNKSSEKQYIDNNGTRMTLEDAMIRNISFLNCHNLPDIGVVNIKTRESIIFEDLVTFICTKFVKETEKMTSDPLDDNGPYAGLGRYRKPYCQMNYAKRRKISKKIIDSILGKQ